MAKKKEEKASGKFGSEDILKLLRTVAKDENVANFLSEENPSDVKEWIPTGCRLLDSLGCKGKREGLIPSGRIVEIASAPSVGKSYIAAKTAGNAQKLGWDVIYFDSEAAINSDFMQQAGVNLETLIYSQAKSVEYVFEAIDQVLQKCTNKTLFIVDSLAFIPTEAQVELDDMNPMASMALKPRILSHALGKIITPLVNKNSSLLIINQLRTKIGAQKWEDQWFIPGGTSIRFAYSTCVRLTKSEAKDSLLYDMNGNVVGTEVTASVTKSRFGTFKKKTTFQIVWGEDNVDYCEKPFWLEYVSSSENLIQGGAWYTLKYQDGTEKKFQKADFLELLDNDQKFYDRISELLDQEILKQQSADSE